MARRGIEWLFIFVTAVVLGCGAASIKKPEPRGTLRFEGNPEDAHLVVDETSLGPVSMFKEQGIKLRPGTHRIVVQKEGYFPEYRLVEVEANTVSVVEIELREVP
jgi:hypothetical protein